MVPSQFCSLIPEGGEGQGGAGARLISEVCGRTFTVSSGAGSHTPHQRHSQIRYGSSRLLPKKGKCGETSKLRENPKKAAAGSSEKVIAVEKEKGRGRGGGGVGSISWRSGF